MDPPVQIKQRMSLNFVTPINIIYPSPLSNVFLVLNEMADLSLYRKNEQIWSAGRFKTLQDIQWSPDGIIHLFLFLFLSSLLF